MNGIPSYQQIITSPGPQNKQTTSRNVLRSSPTLRGTTSRSTYYNFSRSATGTTLVGGRKQANCDV